MATLTTKYKPYPAYKPSGVDWLGEIPAHWEARRLKYLATVNDEALSETTDPDMEITYVDIGNVDSVEGITGAQDLVFEDAPSRARRIVSARRCDNLDGSDLSESNSPNRAEGYQPRRVHWIRSNTSTALG